LFKLLKLIIWLEKGNSRFPITSPLLSVSLFPNLFLVIALLNLSRFVVGDSNSFILHIEKFFFMSSTKQYLPWALRILVALLFLVSALSKMFPLWMFEKQLVDLGITSWCSAHYLARTLIALEFAIGLALLQNNYLRSLVIPGTIVLLLLFNIHLSMEMYKHGAMNGNCGCFGQLIPMTPLEAFIKNLITIGILIYLFIKVRDREKGQNRIIYPLAMFFGSMALLFVAFPFAPCVGQKPTAAVTTSNYQLVDSLPETSDSIAPNEITNQEIIPADLPPSMDTVSKTAAQKKTTTTPASTTSSTDKSVKNNPVAAAPKAVKYTSKFAPFTQFGNNKVNLDEGKKLVCMFAPGCDHCRATAKAIGELSKLKGFPPVYILFMDEETNLIPDFFKETGTNYPHMVLDIPTFWDTMGIGATTPGVYYLVDGQILKQYQGIEQDEFKANDFKTYLGY
jgi:thiol-disulfide isomerase/thioredoxin